MSPLQLKKLPNRETAKITFTASADLQQILATCAKLYEAEHGEREVITTLIPYMLETFVGSDRKNINQSSPHSPASTLKSTQFTKQ